MTLRYREAAPPAPHLLVGSATISIDPKLPSPMTEFLLRMGDSSTAVTGAWAEVVARLHEQGEAVRRRVAEVPARDTEVLYTVKLSPKMPEATLQFFV